MTKMLLRFGFIMALGIWMLPTAMAQTGPGGVGGYEDDISEGAPINCLWLRAEDLDLAEGAEVSSWNDVSGYNHQAVTGIPAAGGIFFEKDKINGYPWVHFYGVNYLKIADHDVLDGGMGFAIFLVAKRDSFKVDKYTSTQSNLLTKRAHWNAWSHVPEISKDPAGLQHAYEIRWDQGGALEEGLDSANITAYMNGNLPDGAGSDVFPTRANTPRTDTAYLISWAYNGLDPETEGSYGAFVRINGLTTNRRYEGNPNPISVGQVVASPKDLWVGAAQLDPPGAFGNNENKDDSCPTCTEEGLLEGAISEAIIYKGILWPTHVMIVENYLSLKYGLPIDTAKYYDDEVFIHDLAGIGNAMGDEHIHGTSFSGALMIDTANNSLDAAREYLFAAHDGADYTAYDDAVTEAELWGRTWRLEELGEVDADLGFDFTEAGITMKSYQDYRLAYKANPEDDFTLLEDVAPSKKLRTIYFKLEGEDLKNGYYTMAYKEEASGIHDYDLSDYMEVWPNPTRDQVRIHFLQEITGELQIRILDYTGREISSIVDRKMSREYERSLSMEKLESGLYYLELRCGEYRAVKALIRE